MEEVKVRRDLAISEQQLVILEEFRDSSRSDMLDTLFDYEMEMRTTASDERREKLQGLLKILWPEYLSA
jgi:hypothetical protein